MANGKRGRDGKLSVAIDPLLLEGGHTVREIAQLIEGTLVKTDGERYPLATIINNIRSRMFVLGERGLKLEKDEKRRVRFVEPAKTETASA